MCRWCAVPTNHLEVPIGDDPLADQRAEMECAVLGHPDAPRATFEAVLAASVVRSRADDARISNTASYDQHAEEPT